MSALNAVVASLLLIVVASGCLGGGKPSESADPSAAASASTGISSPAASSSPPATSPPPDAPDPVANLTADIVNGTVPLQVNFTLRDLANSSLEYVWILDFGDGNETSGSDLPVIVNHTFDAVEDYTVNLTIDSARGTSLANLTITGELGRVVLQRVTGTWDLGATGCLSAYDVWQRGTPLEGVTVVEFSVVAASVGKAFHADFTTDPEVLSVVVDFYDSEGAYIDGESADDGAVTGTVPTGAVLGLLHACNSGAGEVVYEAGINL